MEKELRRTVRLDERTDKLLTRLAARYEGNTSMAVREAVRREAERAGILPAPDKSTWFEREERR